MFLNLHICANVALKSFKIHPKDSTKSPEIVEKSKTEEK
jgi:hypothetical protein